ncbi:NADH-flavin reductase [Mangrovactinospora gilvigrisea]|uniref:NADH-flavin reductase n=1 Tax=Mangrovactinospora gilvigrisea TaxID=1428644 RepID=A0A1J7BHD4_9ACTN|nr:NAD(P)H-binding protein [Mangrovactinospora gilvigrisea]OIV38103.1 NADH-flavin reductase [Mangrovactinospora gilvigrisea]
MRITVIGAAGTTGRRIVDEALARGHRVTAAVRSPERATGLPAGVAVRTADAAEAAQVAALAAGQDALVSATRPAPGREHEHPATARALLRGAAAAGVRVLIVGGAGSLTAPDGGLAVDDPRYVDPAWRAIALASNAQYDAVREEAAADPEADWTYLSPPAMLGPGTRTGRYRLGRDALLTAPDGASAITTEDLAAALLDELEQRRFPRTRFTVAAAP